MPAPSQRNRLLDAASELVTRDGAIALTLDAAAAQAGVSKGGLLYHFPTKAALIEALIEADLDRFERAVDARAATDPRPGAWARAYVDATFDLKLSAPNVARTLLLSGGEMAVLGQYALRFAHWAEQIAGDGLSQSTAALVRYAADGWWTDAVVGGPSSTERGDVLRARLHDLIDAEVHS